MRRGSFTRETRETVVSVDVVLGRGEITVETPVKFLNHMLETLMFYMGSSGRVVARDLRGFDEHHVVEDVALALGSALDRALGDRVGIRRFGWALVPMDDALSMVAVDLGGRPYWVFRGSFHRDRVGDLPTEMVPHFMRSLATTLRANVHVEVRWGENDHHIVESIFKALGLSLRDAVEVAGDGVQSLKGSL
jgi:imidazoleglycerol phosphate dehydratase HisB